MKALHRFFLVFFLIVIVQLSQDVLSQTANKKDFRRWILRHFQENTSSRHRKPKLTVHGVRQGANTVMEHPPSHAAGIGVGGGIAWRIGHKRNETAKYFNHHRGAKIKESSNFEAVYSLGRKITFYCMAEGNPRPHVSWLKDGIELYSHPYFQVHEWYVGNYSIKSKMEIDPATQKDAGFYECEAENRFATDRRGFRTDYTSKFMD